MALIGCLMAYLVKDAYATSLSIRQPSEQAICPDAQLSCHNTTSVDTCCLAYPGGLILQTQFWDAVPAIGPSDSWTIHGLWPDLCGGGYEAYCDKSRQYSNISAILREGGAASLLPYMGRYWKDYQGDDESLWTHEWDKHGTCISTLEPQCYEDYSPQQEVVQYFNVTVELFNRLPTYQTLAAAGVLPSNSRTWTREELETPLKKIHSGGVVLRCRGKQLSEVWYYFSVLGPVQDGKFVPADASSGSGSCPGTGIRYLPKTSPTKTSSTGSTTLPSPTSTSVPFEGKGSLLITVKGETQPRGCLISGGLWYTSGTCASFRVQDDVLDHGEQTFVDGEESHVFTLTSSKGHCGIVNDRFRCAKALPSQTIFGGTSNGTLSFQKQSSFYVGHIPKKYEKVEVSTVAEAAEALEIEISWSSATHHNYIEPEDEL